MSTNRLGRAENLDEFWRESHPYSSETRVDLEVPDEPDTVEALDAISDYPYEGQRRYRGSFEYHFTDWQGNSQTETGEYEYRAESGLFLLTLTTQRVEAKDVLDVLNEQLGSSNKIKDSISVKREALWSFFEEASQYDKLTLTGPEGRFNFNTLKHVAHRMSAEDLPKFRSMSEEEAQQKFEDPEEVKSVLPLLEKIDLEEDFQSLDDLGIEPARYFIERAEVHFEYQDELVTTTYDRGNLKINEGCSENAREFVIQLFEQKVVFPSHGR